MYEIHRYRLHGINGVKNYLYLNLQDGQLFLEYETYTSPLEFKTWFTREDIISLTRDQQRVFAAADKVKKK